MQDWQAVGSVNSIQHIRQLFPSHRKEAQANSSSTNLIHDHVPYSLICFRDRPADAGSLCLFGLNLPEYLTALSMPRESRDLEDQTCGRFCQNH